MLCLYSLLGRKNFLSCWKLLEGLLSTAFFEDYISWRYNCRHWLQQLCPRLHLLLGQPHSMTDQHECKGPHLWTHVPFLKMPHVFKAPLPHQGHWCMSFHLLLQALRNLPHFCTWVTCCSLLSPTAWDIPRVSLLFLLHLQVSSLGSLDFQM